MKYRRFGRTGWQVSTVGYGMWGLAGWQGSDDQETNRGLDLAVARGCNFFDTAWGYGEGRSERILSDLIRRHPEDKLFPLCRELDIGVIARVPFDEGTLTGNLTLDTSFPQGDWRNTYFVPENLTASVERAEAIKKILPSNSSLPEVALKFILQNKDVSTVIPGMRKERHVLANMQVGEAHGLSQDLVDELKDYRWDRIPTEWSQ